jgi:hypothetical protein
MYVVIYRGALRRRIRRLVRSRVFNNARTATRNLDLPLAMETPHLTHKPVYSIGGFSEIQDTFLQKDETANMILDNVFSVVDEQIDLADARIRRGKRPALVLASMRAAVARMRKATY